MRAEKKAARAMEKLQQYLIAAGVDPAIVQTTAEKPVETSEDRSLQAEAVLDAVENPQKYIRKLCKRCGESFLANYRSVAYCGDNCRRKALESLGIQWNPHKPSAERWRGNPPLVVPPQAYRRMSILANLISQGLVTSEPYTQEEVPETHPESNGFRTNLLELPEIEDFDTSGSPSGA